MRCSWLRKDHVERRLSKGRHGTPAETASPLGLRRRTTLRWRRTYGRQFMWAMIGRPGGMGRRAPPGSLAALDQTLDFWRDPRPLSLKPPSGTRGRGRARGLRRTVGIGHSQANPAPAGGSFGCSWSNSILVRRRSPSFGDVVNPLLTRPFGTFANVGERGQVGLAVGVRGSSPLISTLMTRPFPSGGAACVVSVSADQRDEQHDPAERDGCDRVAGGWPQERWPASSVRAPAVSDGGVKELG